MHEDEPLAFRSCLSSYVVTSALLAGAWHASFAYGLWVLNAMAGTSGTLLALLTLRHRWHSVMAWSLRNASVGFAFGVALVLGTQVGGRLLLARVPPLLTETERLYSVLKASLPASFYAPIIASVVIAEELVFRGVITDCLLRRTRFAWTVAIATLLYIAPLLASRSWLLVMIGATLGTCWTVARLWSGSLAVPMIAHIMWSLTTFVVFPLV